MDEKTEIERKRAELEKINKKIEVLEKIADGEYEDANFFSNAGEIMECFEIPLMPAYLLGGMTIEAWEEFEIEKDDPLSCKIATKALGTLCCLPMAATALALASPVLILFGPFAVVISAIESTAYAIHNRRIDKAIDKLEELKERKAELEKELAAYDAKNTDSDKNEPDDEITA